MAYEIVMPQLTDTMETGKIVRWLKKEGDYVEVNEPILEVESDKAIMEVPSLKSGYLTKILFDEGSEVPVGTVIAIISEKKEENIQTPEVKSKEEKKIETVKQEIKEIKIPQTIEIETKKLPPSTASPVAKVLAKEIGIDIKSLQEEGKLPIPAHEKDIKEYIVNQKLDENVINLLKDYQINPEDIIKLYTNIEKITVKEVLPT